MRYTYILSILFFIISCTSQVKEHTQPKEAPNQLNMYPELKKYLQSALVDSIRIPEERKAALQEIAGFINNRNGTNSNLVFICTHNSRRSHMSQIWAATAAHYFGLENIFTFSGGTEATAFNPRAVAAIERAGFKVVNPGGDNPRYLVRFSEEADPLTCFSKVYDDPSNATDDFAAIMTCSDADEACPYIPGTSLRVAIPYVDPKVSDGTPEEAATYDERCRQIAVEMVYVMSRVRR